MLNNKSRYIFLLAFMLILLALPVGVVSAQTTTSDDTGLALGIIGGCVCGAFTLAAWGGATFWIYNDANARGMNAPLWAGIVGALGLFGTLGSFLLGLIGLFCCNIFGVGAVIFYFTQRPDKPVDMGYQQYPPGGPMNY